MAKSNLSEIDRIIQLTPKPLGQDSSLGLWISLSRPVDTNLDVFSIQLSLLQYSLLNYNEKLEIFKQLQANSTLLAKKQRLKIEPFSTQLIDPESKINVAKHEFEHLKAVSDLHPESSSNLNMRVVFSEKNQELRIAGYCFNWELPELSTYENLLVTAAPEILSMGDVILIESLISHNWDELNNTQQGDIRSRLFNRLSINSKGQIEQLTYIDKVAKLLKK